MAAAHLADYDRAVEAVEALGELRRVPLGPDFTRLLEATLVSVNELADMLWDEVPRDEKP